MYSFEYIVENLQEFFDGSQDSEDWVEYPGDNILVSIINPESDRDGYDDQKWESTKIKRLKLRPQPTLEEWIPQHLQDGMTALDPNEKMLAMPVKHIKLPPTSSFWEWKLNKVGQWNKYLIGDHFSWEIKKYFTT